MRGVHVYMSYVYMSVFVYVRRSYVYAMHLFIWVWLFAWACLFIWGVAYTGCSRLYCAVVGCGVSLFMRGVVVYMV